MISSFYESMVSVSSSESILVGAAQDRPGLVADLALFSISFDIKINVRNITYTVELRNKVFSLHCS